MMNLETAELQQQSATNVSQDQESEATVGTGLPKEPKLWNRNVYHFKF